MEHVLSTELRVPTTETAAHYRGGAMRLTTGWRPVYGVTSLRTDRGRLTAFGVPRNPGGGL
jgi:hypothetical protein